MARKPVGSSAGFGAAPLTRAGLTLGWYASTALGADLRPLLYSRDTDLSVNICREKKLTNIRAAGRDENVIITPHRDMGLEAGIEWIADDELVEITPDSVRLRKRVLKQVKRPKRRLDNET